MDFTHAKYGHGTKHVMAQVECDVNEVCSNKITTYVVDKIHVAIKTFQRDNPDSLKEFKNVKSVRRICLPKNVVQVVHLAFSENSRVLSVVCRLDCMLNMIYQYDTFNGNGHIINHQLVSSGDNYHFEINKLLKHK